MDIHSEIIIEASLKYLLTLKPSELKKIFVNENSWIGKKQIKACLEVYNKWNPQDEEAMKIIREAAELISQGK